MPKNSKTQVVKLCSLMPGGVLPAALNSNLALRLHHFRVEQPKMTDLWPKIGLKTFYGFKPPI